MIFSSLDIWLDPADLMKACGLTPWTSARRRLASAAASAAARAAELIEPIGAVETAHVSPGGAGFRAGGLEFSPPTAIVEAVLSFGTAAFAAVTIGEGVDRAVDALPKGLDQLLLDMAASMLAEKARAAALELVRNPASSGDPPPPAFAPGLCGWPARDQAALLAVAGAVRIGITATAAHVLVPRKSVTFVTGVAAGPGLAGRRPPCHDCGNPRCLG